MTAIVMSGTGSKFRFGLAVMAAALALFYGPGFILAPLFRSYFYSYYSEYSNPGLYVIIVGSIYFTVFVLVNYLVSIMPTVRLRPLPGALAHRLFSVVILLFLFLSAHFFVSYDISFRHRGRYSEAGIVPMVHFGLRMVVQYYVLLALLHVLSGGILCRLARVNLSLIAVSFGLSITSALQVVMFALIWALLFTSGHIFSRRLLAMRPGRLFMVAAGAVIIVPAALVVGIGNKIGFDSLRLSNAHAVIIDRAGVVIPRFATSFMSTAIVSRNDFLSYDRAERALESIGFTLSSRAASIFEREGHASGSGNFDTINRSNYLEVFRSHAARAGASPGPLASIFYIPYFPINFIMLSLLYSMIFSSVRSRVDGKIKCGFVGYAAVVYLLLPFFEAPLDIFYVFSPLFAFLVVVVVLGRLIDVRKTFASSEPDRQLRPVLRTSES